MELLAENSPEDRSQIIAAVQQRDTEEISPREDSAVVSHDPRETISNLQALYRISEEAVTPSISLDQLLKLEGVTYDYTRADLK